MYIVLRFLVIVLILTAFSVTSQTKFSGTITSKNSIPLLGATVKITYPESNSILAYTTSDENGYFSISKIFRNDSITLTVSYLGFKNWNKTISNISQNLAITLSESQESLDEVFIEFNPIEKKGDTLNYNVATFIDQDDRVIADIIKKLPGIEIQPNGQILYQNKPIEKYYIDGLDLLEGRYNLANDNLSVKAVQNVQILENHQPVKLLDSLVVSDRASLNIKLKNNTTLTGRATVASGVPVPLWDINFTPILFRKKSQFLGSYQTNNTGNDLTRNLSDFSYSNNTFNLKAFNLLAVISPATPPFSRDRWLDNNVHLGTLNLLQRLKKDVDLKMSINYLSDDQNFEGQTNTEIITPNGTINIDEIITRNDKKEHLDGKLIFEKNTDNQYIKNTLHYSRNRDNLGGVVRRDTTINQMLSRPNQLLENVFLSYIPLGKQVLSINSYLGYTSTDQNLRITPTPFLEALPEIEEDFTIQNLFYNRFATDTKLGFKKSIGNITYATDVGYAFARAKLDSSLENVPEPALEFTNNSIFEESKLYINPSLTYKKDRFDLIVTLPLSQNYFNIQTDDRQQLRKFLFEPTTLAQYEISKFWNSSLRLARQIKFGNISQLYSQFIITDYRTLRRNVSQLPETRINRLCYSLSYRNARKGIFLNFNYNLSKNINNLLYSFDVNSNGSIVTNSLLIDNDATAQRFSVGLDKRIKKLKSLFKFKTSYAVNISERLINNVITDVQNTSLSFTASLDSDITKNIAIGYQGNYALSENSIDTQESDQIISQRHELKAFYYISQSQYFNAEFENYFNSLGAIENDNYFVNFKYQFTLQKSNIDLFVKWQNVFNEDSFVNFYNTENITARTSFNVRPSQLLFGLQLSL